MGEAGVGESVKPNREQIVGILAGALSMVLWWFASIASFGSVVLSYFWLVLIFATQIWVANRVKKTTTRNVIAVFGCVTFLVNTTCWVGVRAGWFRIFP